jgi:hypothetical protein
VTDVADRVVQRCAVTGEVADGTTALRARRWGPIPALVALVIAGPFGVLGWWYLGPTTRVEVPTSAEGRSVLRRGERGLLAVNLGASAVVALVVLELFGYLPEAPDVAQLAAFGLASLAAVAAPALLPHVTIRGGRAEVHGRWLAQA